MRRPVAGAAVGPGGGAGASDGGARAVQEPGTGRRTPGRFALLVMDADSTLTTTEGIDLLAAEAGVAEQVAAVTAAAMRGELDFTSSLRARVAALAGLDADAVARAAAEVRPTPGAAELIAAVKARGWFVGVVSGGFTALIDPVAGPLGVDEVRANTLEVDPEGRLTGQVSGPVVDRAAKAAALREWAERAGVGPEAAVAIGDGANDLDMLAAAGLGVAFHAKPALRRAADACIDAGGLEQVLDLL